MDQAKRQALPALTSLRAFAALAVFAYHLQGHGVWTISAPITAVGYTGVAFFFVLSGIVLAWTFNPGTLRFWWRRLARIYPSHFVTLVIAALVPIVATQASWPAAWPNLLLIQAFARDPNIVFGMNAVSWSLSCEAFFYLLLPIIYVLVRRFPRGRWAFALGLLAITALWTYIRVEDSAYLFHFPPARLGEFVLGVAAGCALREGWEPRIRVSYSFLLTSLCVVACALLVDTYPLPNQLLAVPFAALLTAAAVGDLRGRTKILASRPLVYAGEVSFAFYLVHELVILNLTPAAAVPAPLAALLLLTLSFVAACALHHAVERPAQRAMLAWARNRRPLRPSPSVEAA